MVANTPEGLKVLEASKTVRLTPFARFIGAAYDLEFKFDFSMEDPSFSENII